MRKGIIGTLVLYLRKQIIEHLYEFVKEEFPKIPPKWEGVLGFYALVDNDIIF